MLLGISHSNHQGYHTRSRKARSSSYFVVLGLLHFDCIPHNICWYCIVTETANPPPRLPSL
ncbi:unnamed protein product [Penicillium olsonii]|uniref:Uncharacterized protein n=1 Tax=Penicillium olsonii TaxID=99116 RepID=A0A9W4HHF9_PENOL|nr:unnamed protein product [Penicillium olsonii]CAG8074775.1 unnamed protein product [Penicillium olsonii]